MSSEIITNINKSRYIIKDILSKDWVTEDIPDYSDEEIMNLYLKWMLIFHTTQMIY